MKFSAQSFCFPPSPSHVVYIISMNFFVFLLPHFCIPKLTLTIHIYT